MNASTQSNQGPLCDTLNTHLGIIMVQMGRILKAHVSHPDRADQIKYNSNKKLDEATNDFHYTLDDLEFEIQRAKAVFMRDLKQLRDKKQASQQASQQAAAPAPMQAQPPAPMVIDLEEIKPGPASAPVAPMMATGGSPFTTNRPIPRQESNPVAPFPDMMGAPKTMPTQVPFHRPKPVDEKKPSPKQPTLKTTPKQMTKSGPPSGRLANKPSPMANNQKQTHKLPPAVPTPVPVATPSPAPAPNSTPIPAPAAVPAAIPASIPTPVPPPVAASAPVAAPAAPVAASQPPPAGLTNVPAAQNPFTNATFTLDPTNTDSLMQTGGHDINMDMPMLDIEFGGASSGNGPAEPANMDISTSSTQNNNSNDMSDLDHFFDMGGDSNTNFDDNFNEFMNNDFSFDTFK